MKTVAMNYRITGNPVLLGKVPLPLISFLILFHVFIQTSFVTCTYSSDSPFDLSSNWGGTGLMEVPNARILEDGSIRLGVAEASPYRWYSAGMGILPRIEFTG
ncbi:MAG: YjbH domain-containing protein, partial [Deltaproteobacteria bacterium]|nr:YjbH domain-containing protein [Deltaproteobacteria bacterium]